MLIFLKLIFHIFGKRIITLNIKESCRLERTKYIDYRTKGIRRTSITTIFL